MAFELGIHIKTEADLKDLNLSEEATKKVAKELTAANGQIGQAAQKAAQQTEQGAQQAVAAHERHQRSVFNLQKAVLPLAGGISVLTAAIQAQNPAVGAAVNVLDNFVLGAVSAGAATNGWAGVIKVFSSFLNPWVALVTVAGSAIAYFATQSSKAREEQEKLNNAMRTGGFDFLKEKVQAANTKLDETEKKFETILALQAKLNAPAGSPLARAQDAGLAGQRKELHEASNAAEQAQRDLDTARRDKAKESLPDVQRALDLQLKLAQARERDKPLIESEAAALELKSKGLLDEDIAQQRTTLSGIALAKQREIDRNAAFTESEALRSLSKEQLQQKLQLAEIAVAQGSVVVSTREYAVQLVLLEKESQLAAAIHEKQLTPALAAYIEKSAQGKIAVIDATDAEKKRQEQLKILAREVGAETEEEAKLTEVRAKLSAQTEAAIGLDAQLAEAHAAVLRAAGAQEAADRVSLAGQAEALQKRRELIQAGQIQVEDAPRVLEIIDAQIRATQIKIQQLGQTSIDVAGEVSRVVTDITTAVVNGKTVQAMLSWTETGAVPTLGE